jgi:inner membrane protein
MDNVTHSLAGLALGEIIHRALPPASTPTRRTLLLSAAVAASNLPDLDLLLGHELPSPLGYLLMHRGHTHTLAFVVPQALLIVAATLLVPSARRLLRSDAIARIGLAIALVTGLVGHLGMDWLNSYGVHPFYPLDPRWYYGDAVFIVEPCLWILLGSAVVPSLRSRPLKWLIAFVMAGVPLYAAGAGLMPWSSLIVLAVVAMLFYMAHRHVHRRGASDAQRRLGIPVAGVVLALAFVAAQLRMSALARQRAADFVRTHVPNAELLDVAMTPLPANPICWTFHAIAADARAGTYAVRSGAVSIAPDLLAADACAPGLVGSPVAAVTPAVGLTRVADADLAELRRMANESCWLDAWLRFARIPLTDATHAEDVRFARPGGSSFTRLTLADFAGRPCPTNVPGWGYPRADLLGRTGSQP